MYKVSISPSTRARVWLNDLPRKYTPTKSVSISLQARSGEELNAKQLIAIEVHRNLGPMQHYIMLGLQCVFRPDSKTRIAVNVNETCRVPFAESLLLGDEPCLCMPEHSALTFHEIAAEYDSKLPSGMIELCTAGYSSVSTAPKITKSVCRVLFNTLANCSGDIKQEEVLNFLMAEFSP